MHVVAEIGLKFYKLDYFDFFHFSLLQIVVMILSQWKLNWFEISQAKIKPTPQHMF